MTTVAATPATSKERRAQQAGIRVGILTLLLTVALCFTVLLNNDDGAMAFAFIGTLYSEGIPLEEGGTKGYDGQFAYFIARYGADAIPYLDGPSLRFQRVLYPVTARVLAFGSADLIPWTLLLTNIIAHSATAGMLAYLLATFRAWPYWALIYSLWIGNLFAVRFDLNEPLCMALAIGAVIAYRHDRLWWTVGLLMLSTLAKELGLIFAAGLALHALVRGDWRKGLMIALGPALLFLAWWLVMRGWLGSLPTQYPAARGISFIPFGGLFDVLETTRLPDQGARTIQFGMVALLMAAPALVMLLAALRSLWRRRALPLSVALLLPAAGFLSIMPGVAWEDPVAAYRVGVPIIAAGILFVGEIAPRRLRWLAGLWLPATLILVLLPQLWLGA